MYRFLKCIIIIAILCSAKVLTVAQSANSDWISISVNSSFDIVADIDMAVVHVPVKLKGNIGPGQISLKLFDVSLGNRHEMRLINAIKLLPFNDVDTNLGPALNIQLDLKEIKIQGTYNLMVLATSKDLPDIYLNLTVNIPAATLRPEGPVFVDYPGVLLTGSRKIFNKNVPKSYDELKLNLHEISGKSRLTEIKISSLGFSDANNRKIEGDLEFSGVPTLIDPYGSSSAKYKLTGKFPLGTVNGKVEVYAPQLSAPLLVEFKVIKKVTPLLILLITVLGLIIGYISRTWLQLKIDYAENRIKVMDLIDQMDLLMAKHEDKIFQEKIKESKETLEESIMKIEPEVLLGAITSAEEKVKAALEKLQNDRTKVEELYSKLAELIQPSWSVSNEVEKALTEAKEELKSVDALIEKDNVNVAMSSLNDLHKRLLTNLRRSITEWSNKMVANFQILSTEPRLPITVAENMSQPISQLSTNLDQIRISPKASIDEIQNNLMAMDNAMGNIQKLKELLLNWLNKTLSDVEEAYGVDKLEEKRLEELSAGLKKIFNEFELENNQEQAFESFVHKDIQEMIRLWHNFFDPQIDKILQPDQNILKDLLKKYDYLEASHKIISIQSTETDTPLGHVKEMLPEVASLQKNGVGNQFLQIPTIRQHLSKVVLLKFPRQYEKFLSTSLNRYRTRYELAKLKLLQTVIIGAGIALVGYMLYEPNFVGTPKEIMQIFFWAFGLDVTFNTLIDQVKGVKKTSS